MDGEARSSAATSVRLPPRGLSPLSPLGGPGGSVSVTLSRSEGCREGRGPPRCFLYNTLCTGLASLVRTGTAILHGFVLRDVGRHALVPLPSPGLGRAVGGRPASVSWGRGPVGTGHPRASYLHALRRLCQASDS